jgi:hypothetical protein
MALTDWNISQQAGTLLLSGMAGAAVPVALSERMTVRDAGLLTFVGLVVSYYLTPVICHFLGLTNSDFAPAAGFVIGMTGVTIARAITSYADTTRVQGIIGRLVDAALGRHGVPPEPPRPPARPVGPPGPEKPAGDFDFSSSFSPGWTGTKQTRKDDE